MDGWTHDPPRIPGHFWLIVPGWEHEPNVEHIQYIDDVLKVLDETTGAWRSVEDVYPAEHDYLWWGPLMPPVGPSAIEK